MKYPDVMMEIDMQEVATMTSDVEQPPVVPRGFPQESLEEQMARKGVQPVRNADDMTQHGVFESDEELEEFLAYLYAARHSDLA